MKYLYVSWKLFEPVIIFKSVPCVLAPRHRTTLG